MPVARVRYADLVRYEIDLVGLKDEANLVFTTPDKFLEDTIRVYRNGVRQDQGVTDDYVVSESGGVGTGYDTVTLLSHPPRSTEHLFADYTVS